MPGEATPDDIIHLFGPPLGVALSAALSSGDWVVDWWEGDPRPGLDEINRGYYIRPRARNDKPKLFNGSWGGECSFLAPGGCELLPQGRPASCRLLEPKANGSCIMHDNGGKSGAAIAWIEHHDLILSVAGAIRLPPPTDTEL